MAMIHVLNNILYFHNLLFTVPSWRQITSALFAACDWQQEQVLSFISLQYGTGESVLCSLQPHCWDTWDTRILKLEELAQFFLRDRVKFYRTTSPPCLWTVKNHPTRLQTQDTSQSFGSLTVRGGILKAVMAACLSSAALWRPLWPLRIRCHAAS